MHVSALLPVLALFACVVSDDSAVPIDLDTGTFGHGIGLTGRKGQATVDPGVSWIGTETWYFIADEGMGEPICLISRDTINSGLRTDCSACEWAFELAWNHPRVDADEPPGCQALLGTKPHVITNFNESVSSYGYTGQYFGHAEMVMDWTAEGGWAPFAWASYDVETGVLRYDHQEGYAEY